MNFKVTKQIGGLDGTDDSKVSVGKKGCGLGCGLLPALAVLAGLAHLMLRLF